MSDLYSPGGVRNDARLVVAKMVNRVGQTNKKRVYLGLPHKEWSDFHVVKANCPSVFSGIGVEKNKEVIKIAKANMPTWCLLLNGDLADKMNTINIYFGSFRVSAGWIDLMGQVGSVSYDRVLEATTLCLDTTFNVIPMAFTWYAGREGPELKAKLSAFAKANWDEIETGDRHEIRAGYIVDRLNKNGWAYEPFEILSLRERSPMKLMTGVFNRV